MKWWQSLSDIGLNEDTSSWSRRRAKLTNRMIFIAIIVVSSYIPVSIGLDDFKPLIQNFVLISLLASLFYFSKKGKHTTAAILICFLLIIHIIFVTVFVSGGPAKFYLVQIAILGYILIGNRIYGFFVFLSSMLGFFLIEFLQIYIEPIAERADDTMEIMYLFNFFMIFLAGWYLIIQQRNTNREYEQDIIQQKEEIKSAHHQLQESHEEIRASIAYAKRIQSAILPDDEVINNHLPDSFVVYLPKDVVAGDFYWLEHSTDELLFAVADCTGHGVPGAMVSVVCNNALNRSVREDGLTSPAKILDRSREIVMGEFERSSGYIQDGMDIALCSISAPLNSDAEKVLRFSGAHNPLWLIRNGEVTEYKGDRQPVGEYLKMDPFTEHEIQLQKGDVIYLFSDGYADQFGGPKGKKFKSKEFQKLLLSIHEMPMDQQKEEVLHNFNTWKADFEQVDDICVIGVRV